MRISEFCVLVMQINAPENKIFIWVHKCGLSINKKISQTVHNHLTDNFIKNVVCDESQTTK